MRKIKVVRQQVNGMYTVQDESDMAIFLHCTNGSCAVVDIDLWRPVFELHGVEIEIVGDGSHG